MKYYYCISKEILFLNTATHVDLIVDCTTFICWNL